MAKSWLNRNVLSLGLVSFFTDVSSEMIFPLLPIFLSRFLGVGSQIIGLIEGIADSISSLLDIFVGYFSDSRKSRKQFVLAGYGLSALTKMGIAFASIWPQFLFLRGFERLGKSIRSSPRDAIIAGSTDEASRAKAFGLHRMLDTLGAIAGPAIAYLILSSLGDTESAYRTVFTFAILPAFIAVALIALLVREPKKKVLPQKKRAGFWQSLKLLTPNYRSFVLISCIFSLAYFSFALLILRAHDLGITDANILLLYLLYNIVYALASVPIGALADKFGKKNTIICSFVLYALICIGFASLTQWWQIALLFAFYGIFVSADESVNKAYISGMVKDKSRGIALGAYNSAVGAAYLPANLLLGFLWAAFGPAIAFFTSASLAAFAAVALFSKVK
ncbi:Multidrug resistance protein MdtG [Candidatus Anstonella stagnisolia]|nr:Multidrug resistance protein MdtG [Candidatus Anstonella stagnisolia]